MPVATQNKTIEEKTNINATSFKSSSSYNIYKNLHFAGSINRKAKYWCNIIKCQIFLQANIEIAMV